MSKATVPAIVVMMLLLPVLYIGSYAAMLTPRPATGFCWDGRRPLLRSIEHYRFQNKGCHTFFYPMNCLDRRIRPAYSAGLLARGAMTPTVAETTGERWLSTAVGCG